MKAVVFASFNEAVEAFADLQTPDDLEYMIDTDVLHDEVVDWCRYHGYSWMPPA